MLKKTCFTLASVATLSGMVWTVGAGCSSSDTTTPAATNDGGGSSSGGNDSGTKTDEDSGGTTTQDSGGTTTKDSGGTITPNAKITYGTCPAFAKCASDPVGNWTVSGGCLSDQTFAAAKNNCPNFKETNVDIKAGGTVTVTATNVTRNSVIAFSATVSIPKVCAQGASCAQIQVAMTTGLIPGIPQFDSATCKDSGTNCDCDVKTDLSENTNDTYTSAKDGTLTTSGAKGDRTFDYCVTGGNKISYQETTAQSLPFVVEMTK